MRITPNNAGLGARVEGIDLAKPLTDADFRTVLRALGQHGVLCFPRQTLDADQLAAFGRRFGELEINVANAYHEPDHPEMMILSNMKPDGKQIGANDAGQGWHTDMSYSHDIALANILHAQARADAQRQAAGRDAVPQHARRLRGPAGRAEAPAGRPHRDA